MTKIMIIGANGGTARILIDRLLAETDHELVLFLRHAERLAQYQSQARVTVLDGDVLDTARLAAAMAPVDLVYSNVGGVDLAAQTRSILAAMAQTKQQRLLFISALGAHHEVSGKFGAWNEQAIADFLPGFRASATLLSESAVNYTEIRPAWLTDASEVDYELTTADEPFKGTEVSRASVADFAMTVIAHPEKYQRASVGINKPNTDGDRPSWL
jgi:putative NADH-flavin reductase